MLLACFSVSASVSVASVMASARFEPPTCMELVSTCAMVSRMAKWSMVSGAMTLAAPAKMTMPILSLG